MADKTPQAEMGGKIIRCIHDLFVARWGHTLDCDGYVETSKDCGG
ncbi:hypothetical protein JL2886_02702 [Phaeobacter gallaeciensis]|uniref:Uncharacterized protein n=1 Tax=Phaeobacter gallaeciensis TaxID=60890 RepID=A0A1B0ZTZ3_9RHOB|nr:hypothetical protein [Phaeobacter sp. JL2872]ANP37590.1 hypothetical protein JL2886_02702 [Phaeobacter gallaeciensis]